MEHNRLYIGNLPLDTKEDDIIKKFSKFGSIISTEIKHRYNIENEISSTFAFVTLEANRNNLNKCIDEISLKKWKGQNIKLELAKESFLTRLKKEWDENSQIKIPEIKSKNQILDIQANGHNSDSSSEEEQKGGLSKFSGTKSLLGQDIVVKEPKNKKGNTNIEVNNGIKSLNFFPSSEKEGDSKFITDVSSGVDELTKSNNFRYDGSEEFTTYEIQNPNFYSEECISKEKLENSRKRKNNANSLTGTIETVYIKNESNLKDKNKFDKVADEKRRKAFEEKRQIINEQKNAVKMALAYIDCNTKSNKKIVFNDSENVCYEEGKEKNDNENVFNQLKKKKLFDNESDSEDTSFVTNQHFESAKGEKLLQLQSKYAHDSRFTLDSRFHDSEEENDKDPKSEKDKQLEILEQVVGFQLRKPKNTKNNISKSVSMDTMLLRFDPTKAEHSRFIVQQQQPTTEIQSSTQEKKKKKVKSDKINKNAPEEKVEVSKEKFYKVDEQMKHSLENKDNSKFSLRKLFNSSNDKEDFVSDNEDKPTESKFRQLKKYQQPNPFKYDSSDTEEEGDINGFTNGLPPPQPTLLQPFFFQVNDPRFEELKDFFGKYEKTNEEEFNKKRKDLKRLIHHRQLNKRQKDNPFKNKLGGSKKGSNKKSSFKSKSRSYYNRRQIH